MSATRFPRLPTMPASPLRLASLTSTTFLLGCRAAMFGVLTLLVISLSPSPAVGQTPTLPTARMQQLVDDLELQLQLTYRGEVQAYNDRRAEVQTALKAWNDSQRTSSDLETMQQWLQTALRASMPGLGSALPPTPTFEALPEPVVETVTVVPAPVESTPDPTPPATGFDELPMPKPSAPVASERTSSPTPVVTAVDSPVTPVDPPALTTEIAPPQPVVPPKPPRLAEHPAAADLAWGNPFVDDPLPKAVSAESEFRTTRFRPSRSGSPQAQSASRELTVRVNLSELSAKIRGYQQGLDFVEAELLASPSATGFQLAGLAREMESLDSQRELIELYLARLSEIERMAMEELPAADGVLKMLAEQAKQRRTAVDEAASRAPAVIAERAVLDGLKRKLTELEGDAS